jgi:hypothetical protein
MTNCGFCGHPGVHAQILPPAGPPSKRCQGCPQCEREAAEEAKRPDKESGG